MARNKRSLFLLPVKPKWSLSDRARRYTLLVAWHKFDRYERTVLQGLVKVPLEKLPFTPLGTVMDILLARETAFRYQILYKDEIPVRDFRKRIIRAAWKEDRKRRQRIRV